MAEQQPWATGPHEILHHALELMREDTDTNRRLAMSLVDNAVEQMIKTYLNLPKRINGLTIPRARRQQIADSFPNMLDALEEFAADKLVGVDLGTIEWYHRLRNQLYHEGFGLTVTRDNVNVYSELANSLFKNLFGFDVVEPQSTGINDRIANLIQLWNKLERGLIETASDNDLLGQRRSPIDTIRFLNGAGIVDDDEYNELNQLRQIRNAVVHGLDENRASLTDAMIERLRHYAEKFGENEPPNEA